MWSAPTAAAAPGPPAHVHPGRGVVLGEGDDGDDGDDGERDDELLVFRRAFTVFFHADVTKASVLRLVGLLHDAAVSALRTQASPLHPPRVTLYIHSDGGDAHAGLSAMAHIANCALPVVAITDGFVASAATLLLLGAHERYALPNANVLVHQVRMDCQDKMQDLQDDMSNAELLAESITLVYRERMLMGDRFIRRLLRRELYLSAEQCVRWGLVSAILAPPPGWVPTRVVAPRLAPTRAAAPAVPAAPAGGRGGAAPQPQSSSRM